MKVMIRINIPIAPIASMWAPAPLALLSVVYNLCSGLTLYKSSEFCLSREKFKGKGGLCIRNRKRKY